MSPEEILRRVSEESFLHCWEKDEIDAKGKIIKRGRRITREMVAEAVEEIFEVLVQAPPIGTMNTPGYIAFKKQIDLVLGE